MIEGEHNPTSKHLARNVVNADPQDWKGLKIAWSQLHDLAIRELLPDEQILQLRDIITLVGASALSISFISEEDTAGAVYLSTGQTRIWQGIREFLLSKKPGSGVIFGSATLFEPYGGFFNDLAGTEVHQTIFPDLRNATKKMELIPDTWKLGAYNFKGRLSQIVATVRTIAERERQPIYLLAPNAKKAAVLEAKLEEIDVTVDYYRSDGTLGVERKDRVCITVGLAQIPSNTYDKMARGSTPEERFLDSRRLRELSVHAATWQAVNRVRDPSGTNESRVYFIGVRLNQVKQVALWGTNRTLELIEIREIKNSKTDISKTPVFKVKVDDAIETPPIQGEINSVRHSERRSVKDFINHIDRTFIKRKNDSKVPNIIYGENGAIFTLYNFPIDKSQIESTAEALFEMFCHRRDCYIRQVSKPGLKEPWTWAKYNQPITIDLLKKHIAGEITIGSYTIGLNDTVKVACIDLDSHKGETDTVERLLRLLGVLRT